MQTIGERLEDARKRKGISLREAAEATKIRSDFLSKIEQNKFDFELPEIYKRGFIRNYARYLKLDSDKITTDFSAQQLGNHRNRKNGAEWFGAMDIQSSEKATASNDPETAKNKTYGSIKAKPVNLTSEPPSDGKDQLPDDGDRMFYLKAGLIFVVTIILVFILIRAIFDNSPKETTHPTPPTSVIESRNEFKLIASGTVFAAVRQLDNRKMLFQGTLSTGEEISLQKNGPVEIVFTVAENIMGPV